MFQPPAGTEATTAPRKGWLAHQSIFPAKFGAGSKLEAAEGSGDIEASMGSGLTPSPVSAAEGYELEESVSIASPRRNRVPASKRTEKEAGREAGRERKNKDNRYISQPVPPIPNVKAETGSNRARTHNQHSHRTRRSSESDSHSDNDPYDSDDPYALSTSSLSSASTDSLSGSSISDPDYSDTDLPRPDPIAIGIEGVTIPSRLEVLDDRRGYWAGGKEGLRKYHDPVWLGVWLFSVLGVLIGLCFVWGGTDVSEILEFLFPILTMNV